MSNLLEETIAFIKGGGKDESDVVWCGSEMYGSFTWDKFKELADKEYDNGFGSQKVCTDLLVVGKDWWLERHEYDGSEGWEFKSLPVMPEERDVVVIVDDAFRWQSLEESNRPGGKYGDSNA